MKESQMHFLKGKVLFWVTRKGQKTLNRRCRKLHSDKPYKRTGGTGMQSAEDGTKTGQLEEPKALIPPILQGVDPSSLGQRHSWKGQKSPICELALGPLNETGRALWPQLGKVCSPLPAWRSFRRQNFIFPIKLSWDLWFSGEIWDRTGPQGKQLKFISLWKKFQNNSRTIRGGWGLPREREIRSTSHSQSQETFPTKLLKGSDVRATQSSLCWNPSRLRDACTHVGGSWKYSKYELWTRTNQNEVGQRKPRKKCLTKRFKYAWGVSSLWSPPLCVSTQELDSFH